MCRCACGKEKSISSCSLVRGSSRSCGCSQRTTHNLTGAPEYIAWQNMKARCYNKDHDYFYLYGGRGIEVCSRWKDSFENFIADMGSKPSNKHSIDRIDVNKNYEPTNCRWVTLVEQNNNKRNNRLLTYKETTKTLAQWCRHLGLTKDQMYARLKTSDDLDEIFKPRESTEVNHGK